jgi:hypothetical protein
MPIFLLSLALAWEIPRSLFQEKPPLFIDIFPDFRGGYELPKIGFSPGDINIVSGKIKGFHPGKN